MWLFGYGSLIWKVDFKYSFKQIGYIKGFKRRFWWWSEDHRGVPGDPGRVVNLLPSDDPESRVWGVAFQIDDDLWTNEVEPHLDHREKGGYNQTTTMFYPNEVTPQHPPVEVTMYVGQMSHRQYAGPAPIEDIAMTIKRCVGPSGPNIDYLYNLADAIRSGIVYLLGVPSSGKLKGTPMRRSMGQDDLHVFQLERELKKLEEQHEQ